MTTVLIKPTEFFAVDSKWTSSFGIELHEHVITKYIYRTNVVAVYAGDELPIVLHQALLLGLLDHSEYLNQTSKMLGLDFEFSHEETVLDFHDGNVLTSTAQQPKYPIDLYYQGTGGHHAADFYYFSKKKQYVSRHGCDIIGSMYYAYTKDVLYSGGVISSCQWVEQEPKKSGIKSVTDIYKTQVSSRIEELFMHYQSQSSASAVKVAASSKAPAIRKIVTPPMRTGDSSESPKATLSRAVNTVKELEALGLI